MAKRTPLYDCHVPAGAQIVPVGGCDMPLHYGSQTEEHHAVRRRAGVFDVSHMTVVDIHGAGATAYLQRLRANDVARLAPAQALYSCMLNEQDVHEGQPLLLEPHDGLRVLDSRRFRARPPTRRS